MKRHPLIFVNSAFLALLIAGFAVLYVKTFESEEAVIRADAASSGTGTGTASTEAVRGDLDAINRRLAALETRCQALQEKLEAVQSRAADRPSGSGKPPAEGDGAETKEGPADPEGVGEAGPLKRGDIQQLVDKAVDKKLQELQEQWYGSRTRRQKKTLREVARELNLTSDQEMKIGDLYQGLEREAMKVLFGLEDDKALETLKAQLREAEVNPELKASLREKIDVNWTLYRNQISAIYVRADAGLRKILNEEQLKQFYGYDVELDEREFPDIEKMFYGEEGDGD
ncbi:MAG: hypothetical protein ACYTHM_15070 [Planctomycetota bacterium]|jgi:hypothetical protein